MDTVCGGSGRDAEGGCGALRLCEDTGRQTSFRERTNDRYGTVLVYTMNEGTRPASAVSVTFSATTVYIAIPYEPTRSPLVSPLSVFERQYSECRLQCASAVSLHRFGEKKRVGIRYKRDRHRDLADA